jgi:hypothetical protein
MTDPRNNVLLPIAFPTQKSLRAAVANIIRQVQAENKLTDDDFADAVACSVGTIRNARNEQADLNATTIARIGAKFGAEHIDPYSALWGARNVPLETQDTDALPSMSAAVHRLAVAQSPDSPGGRSTTHCELLDMLPDLREAQRAINALLVRAERIAA